jgi:hypothetical protein
MQCKGRAVNGYPPALLLRSISDIGSHTRFLILMFGTAAIRRLFWHAR